MVDEDEIFEDWLFVAYLALLLEERGSETISEQPYERLTGCFAIIAVLIIFMLSI